MLVRVFLKDMDMVGFGEVDQSPVSERHAGSQNKPCTPYLNPNRSVNVHFDCRLRTDTTDHARCHGNKIMSQCLWYKREWSRYPKIAFNHFNLVVLGGRKKMNVNNAVLDLGNNIVNNVGITNYGRFKLKSFIYRDGLLCKGTFTHYD